VGRIDKKPPHTDLGGRFMILGEMILPQNKQQLMKRIQNIRDVQFKVIDDVTRADRAKAYREIDRYLSSKNATFVIITGR
jgi:hypothetical protein